VTSPEVSRPRRIGSALARGDVPARAVAASLILVWVAQSVLGLRGLFADGGYYLWVELSTGDFFVPGPSRVLADVITQLPVVAALRIGVTNPQLLALLQSFGMVAIPAAMWLVALWVLRRRDAFWSVVVAFAVVTLSSGFMAAGEYNVGYAVAALSAALLLRERIGPASAAVLLVLALVLAASYESAVYLAPLLGVATIVQLRRARRSAGPRRVVPVLLVLCLAADAAAVVLSAFSIAFPRDPRNRAGAADLVGSLLRDPQLALAALVAVAWVALTLVLPPRLMAVRGLVAGLVALPALLPPLWFAPGMQYAGRTAAGLLLFVMLAGLFAAQWRGSPAVAVAAARAPGWIAATVVLVAMMVPFAARTDGFGRWLASFETRVLTTSAEQEWSPPPSIAAGQSLYVWGWTNPFLSRLFEDDPGQGMILNPGQKPGTDPSPPAPLPSRLWRVDRTVTLG